MGRHLVYIDAGWRVGHGEGGDGKTSGSQRDAVLGKEGMLIRLVGCSHKTDVGNRQFHVSRYIYKYYR